MADFGATINAQLTGRTVQASLLTRIEFASGDMRLWLGGAGILDAGGETWAGIGALSSVDEIAQSIGGSADPFHLTLSGVDDDVLQVIADGIPEAYGRDVTGYLQFFDGDWATLDDPLPIGWGVTSNIEISETGGDRGSSPQRTVRVPVEPILVGGSRPRFAYWSDRDQQKRFPGDRGCERMSVLTMQTIRWPDFT